ncbi:MAG: hypothetical protein AOA65_1006 [Candidatus Bathyarchaeota archaeon BA1]|nr:MAG: hypothetical protein AOA65_1006 [Candidatus Bathyarchaeota archaeon BA1]
MKIYTLFLGKGKWGIGWPYVGYDEEELCGSIIRRLKEKFPHIEFTGSKVVSRYDAKELWEIKRGIKDTDGVFLCIVGNYGTNPLIDNIGVESIEVGKPTVLASYMYGGDWGFIRIYERVRGRKLSVLPVSSSDLEDFEKAIGIMERLHEMREKRIMIFTFDEAEVVRNKEDRRRLLTDLLGTDIEKVGEEAKEWLTGILSDDKVSVDVHGVDQAVQWRRNVDKYKENLRRIFGLEMVRCEPSDLCRYYENASPEEAERIADEWVRNAERVNASRQTIVNAARLYLALKKLIEDTGCDAVGIECCPVLMSGKIPAFPCMAFSKLNDEGTTAACESDVDSAVTLLLGRYVVGRPGMMGNYCLDVPHNRATYLHCMSPTKLHGYDKPPLEYYITKHGEAHFLGASPVVRFPSGEDVTTVKVSVLHGKICIRYGRSLGLVEDEKACRDKLLVETNAAGILEKHDQNVFGWHKVSFLGDLRQEFKAAARLLGLEVVEEHV